MTFNKRDFHKERNGEFVCGSYKRKGKDTCTTHYVTYEKVYQILLADIKSKSREANKNEMRFVRSLEQENEILAARKTSTVLQDVQQTRVRIGQLDQIISKLYEDSALGVIPQERFNLMFPKYDAEQKELKSRIAEVDRIEQQQAEASEKVQSFTQFIKEITGMTELTSDILSKLIKRISVGQARINPITGEKEQDIDVDFAIA